MLSGAGAPELQTRGMRALAGDRPPRYATQNGALHWRARDRPPRYATQNGALQQISAHNATAV